MQTEKQQTYWQAIQHRDKEFEGKFLFGVVSTGIFCRPGCPSRTPSQKNVRYFANIDEASAAGFRPCQRCRPEQPALQGLERLCSYITDHVDEPLPLSKLSEISGLSPFHLQRKFKAAFGISPRQFADQRRLERLKSSMRSGFSVTDAIYDAGFGSSSRVYERSASQLGMTPKQYRNGGASETIHYAFEQTPFGLLLVAATALGICAIQFGDSETTLLKNLAAEFPDAVLQPGSDELASHLSQLSRWLAGQRVPLDLPLDIRATTFQRLVWEYLKKIPYGETRSYSQIAHDLGAPNATRAVARACATNPVALAIPCHRVVKQDGKLAGYRWGIDRKRSLLDLEQGRSAAPGNQLPQIGV